MNQKIDAFLRHPVVQSISGAFLGGIIGFLLAAFAGSLFGASHQMLFLCGLGGAFAMATWGVRSQMSMVDCKQYKFDGQSLLVSTGGSMILFAAVLSLFGFTSGGVALAGAIAGGLLTGMALAACKRRCHSCKDDHPDPADPADHSAGK